ncbi:MAG: ABC transporter substrate-binding protein [Proteobacteria bacterium]|nr:ABC transporter substrate-binding protein [Pseudomonadota bacterium]MBU4447934.1 ABC transporter substrate-binding protein [Pseudomonadota bacterium]MCG2773851.1 ABC transporter substrate-binding protein [Desulfobacterales bacterium]
MKKPLWIWIISLALIACSGWTRPALAQTPTAYVRGILDQVMSLQNDPAQSTQARSQAIHKIIERNFDFALMAKDSLGPTYERLSGGQRQEFTQTFSYLFQDSYARLVLNFLKQENIQYGRELPQGDKARVDTAIVRTNENIPVTYLMHTTPQGWILYDVMVDGVSILQNYKTQFARVIRTNSFEFLLNKMQEQRRAIQ